MPLWVVKFTARIPPAFYVKLRGKNFCLQKVKTTKSGDTLWQIHSFAQPWSKFVTISYNTLDNTYLTGNK